MADNQHNRDLYSGHGQHQDHDYDNLEDSRGIYRS